MTEPEQIAAIPHDLKPCPFCNGAGILTGDHKAVKVNCELCAAECGPWYSAGPAGEAKASDMWNTRFPAQSLVEEPERDVTIAELEAALREFLDAARYDPHMNGNSTFMGWKQSDLRRAETRARAALKGTAP